MFKNKDLLKLTRPLHIKYISEFLLKTNLETTQKILNEYVNKGILQSEDNYYFLSNQKFNAK